MVSDRLAVGNRFLGVFGVVPGSRKVGVVTCGFLVYCRQ